MKPIKRKSTGIVRRIDDLGRIVIPRAVRREVGVEEGTPFEIYTCSDGSILLTPYHPMVDEDI